MKFTPEDFDKFGFVVDEEVDDLAVFTDQAASLANAKLNPILERLEEAEKALEVCKKHRSPTAMDYFLRHPKLTRI